MRSRLPACGLPMLALAALPCLATCDSSSDDGPGTKQPQGGEVGFATGTEAPDEVPSDGSDAEAPTLQ